MSNILTNIYKISRECAGLTQEQAAEALHVGVRQLSDYENGKARVPEDTVDTMCDTYSSPALAYFHLQTSSKLGKRLPKIFLPETHSDMAFQIIISEDEIRSAASGIKAIMSNGKVDTIEWKDFTSILNSVRTTANRLLSAVVYGEKLLQDHKEKEGGD